MLLKTAEKLRDYLVEHDFAGDDGDIPDEIWVPFCEAIKQEKNKYICNCTKCLSSRAGHYVKSIDDFYRE